MGKIAPISAKYIINAKIEVEGVVEKPDVIGAIFGQTEGLLGSDLELRELQKSGKIGRIDVELITEEGKTSGTIIIPSSLDKTETAVVGAAIETIQRIGPCDSKIQVTNIEDVRINKREFLMKRARDLLKTLEAKTPEAQEITEKVRSYVRKSEIVELGPDRISAGPDFLSSDEVILVEGRADVLNLLKHGITNCLEVNGTSIPKSIQNLCKGKSVTVLVDGDRGGDLIVKALKELIALDFVAKAPEGKEIEELTGKELLKALRSRIPLNDFLKTKKSSIKRTTYKKRYARKPTTKSLRIPKTLKSEFLKMMDELIGTKGAYLLDKDLNILGKIPLDSLLDTIPDVENAFAVLLDGEITEELVKKASYNNVKYLVGTSKTARYARGVKVILKEELE